MTFFHVPPHFYLLKQRLYRCFSQNLKKHQVLFHMIDSHAKQDSIWNDKKIKDCKNIHTWLASDCLSCAPFVLLIILSCGLGEDME